MSRAISFWQPMASIVIGNESLSSICFNSSGIAVISLDFASVATWPKAIPSSLAQVLTMWSAPSSFEASMDRRHVLPSIAISRFGPLLSVLVTCASQS